MPRKSRECYLSDFYHVMIQGDEKKFIFTKAVHKEKLVCLINKNAIRNNINIIAYCVMNNHAHILLYCENLDDLSKMMLQCNTSYGHYYSKNRGCVGHVFRERYRSEPIVSKLHLINCIKYIHENPVKSKLVKCCKDYKYSSYNEYLIKSGIFSDKLMKLCEINEKEYLNIINNNHTDLTYMDEFEDATKFFEEIKINFKRSGFTNEDIVTIYKEMLGKCNITKTQLAKFLNIDRKKVSRILCKYGYGRAK